MDALQRNGATTILSGHADWIDAELLSTLSEYPLDSINTEYPHFARSVDGPDDMVQPSEAHPVFYGSFDWHSAVHNHWCLVRQLRLFEDHPEASAIVSLLEDRFTREKIVQEATYFEDNASFEKPYGWAWFLRFVAELHLWDEDRAAAWREMFEPLERQIVELFEREFLTQERPFRVGTHTNSAFALAFALDYARVVADDALERAIVETSREFFLDDEDYPVEYEPLGWDFVSPALTEADLMRRVLDREAFQQWFETFSPAITDSPYDSLLQPIDVDADGDDGLELHFVGLNLSKAWSMAGIASALDDQPTAEALEQAAQRHIEQSVEPAFTDDYAGAHWLSSFVLYVLTRNEGGIAPNQ
ncbi:DUF2891 domain-containing protein [Haloarcula nitratireducens]|uniref:DUF2891 domain-containing protein n=1 Tax=Haloarcula nitratireducens TaxID=2487749 RepID=A0AAW4PI75_9EURY|nr:DUF2891 domain-containing protein [Halomicroarcula nitratireducens]MBX0297623.1 DUF2891 domain-containing protein [Halomicroarcula nitratireducens]